MARPILPYPGGKTKFRRIILSKLAQYRTCGEYREPFVGAGAIATAIITASPHQPAWINDKDIGIYCLWKSIRDYPDLLERRVRHFTPSVAAYNQAKMHLLSNPAAACDHDAVHIGFCKIVVHCLSFSSIGVTAGPLGGERQKKSRIDRKWHPEAICAELATLRHCLSCVRITNMDYADLIHDQSARARLYIDPPYFGAGVRLYPCHFSTYQDHADMARLLRQTFHQWVLSYNDCPEIRQLYQCWADIERLTVIYTVGRRRRVKGELLISSR